MSSPSSESWPSRACRVLVVDDDPDAVMTLTTVLQQAGHEVEGVNDPHLALEALGRFDPDVVLTDLRMPGMTGMELARQIRKTRSGRPVLIAISAEDIDPKVLLSDAAGFDHHMVKPCDLPALLKLLADIKVT